MQIQYSLSKKQIEAMTQGKPLRIAVPCDPHLDGTFYMRVPIAGVDPERVKTTETATVYCSLLNRGGGGPDSLQSKFGEILDTHRVGDHPAYRVNVMIFVINEGASPTRWAAGPITVSE